jgi:hypothetical protein
MGLIRKQEETKPVETKQNIQETSEQQSEGFDREDLELLLDGYLAKVVNLRASLREYDIKNQLG